MSIRADESQWSTRLAMTVGGNVRRHRKAKRMSARMLAEALEAIGHKLERSVIANMEVGRRPYLTVADLYALASVLGVETEQLLTTDGRIEILPGKYERVADEQPTPLVITRTEVAELLGVDPRTVTEGIRQGVIPCVRIGRRVLIPRDKFMAIFERDPEPTVSSNGDES